jgi:SAM-dependent methyltransferase
MNHNFVHTLGRWKGYLLSHLREAVYALAYADLLPAPWRRHLIARFWEQKAESIHAEWGHGRHDFDVLRDVLRRYRPARLLDAGCGSGRLFPLYQECGIPHVVGVDVSETALEIARNTYPDAQLYHMELVELDFPPSAFDLCICNRVLQHVPPADIRNVIASLARVSRVVYVNELAESDGLEQTFFMHRHDYRQLFGEAGLSCLESGGIGQQTYMIFGSPTLMPVGRTESQS